MRFLPMRYTRQEELVLHTYGEGNRRGRAGDSGTVRTTLGSHDWLLWWSSSDKNRTNILPTFPSCSSVLQFLRAATNWTHTARNPWRLGFGVAGKKFDEYGPLFIGVLGPTRRGDGILQFLSINRTLIQLRLEDFWKGMNFGLVTVWKLNFPAGLTRLSKIPYPKLVRRVWSGYNSGKPG
jgi:hypothetical protein